MTITALPDAPSRSDAPATFITKADALLAAWPTFVTETNATAAAMNLNSTTDTSASSVAIGTGAKSFTVSAGKSFLGGMWLVIADAAAPSTNSMVGQVTSYSGTSLVMNITAIIGSGTKSSWLISQSAQGGAAMGVNADITQLTAINAESIPAVGLKTSAVPNVPMINGYIEWSIAANALTAAVKTLAGTDPSVTDPVFVTFRDPTLTNGGFYVRAITAALSITASSGSRIGTFNGIPSRIRAVAMDNAGTVVLGLYNPVDEVAAKIGSLIGLNESLVYSSTAEGGAGAADSAHVIYTASAQTSKAIREISYMDSTQTTAGTWAQAITNKVQITATTPKTGQVLQSVVFFDGGVATGTTVIPFDDTIPQNTEGDQYMSQAITPRAAANLLRLAHEGNYASSSSVGTMAAAFFQDSVASALAVQLSGRNGTASASSSIAMSHRMVAGTVSATTFKVRVGYSGAGTTTFNGAAGARYFGGAIASKLEIEEIMV